MYHECIPGCTVPRLKILIRVSGGGGTIPFSTSSFSTCRNPDLIPTPPDSITINLQSAMNGSERLSWILDLSLLARCRFQEPVELDWFVLLSSFILRVLRPS
jgi:hypothetical protein